MLPFGWMAIKAAQQVLRIAAATLMLLEEHFFGSLVKSDGQVCALF